MKVHADFEVTRPAKQDFGRVVSVGPLHVGFVEKVVDPDGHVDRLGSVIDRVDIEKRIGIQLQRVGVVALTLTHIAEAAADIDGQASYVAIVRPHIGRHRWHIRRLVAVIVSAGEGVEERTVAGAGVGGVGIHRPLWRELQVGAELHAFRMLAADIGYRVV